jgi:hypothetical protein
MQVPIQTGVKLQDGGFATSYPTNLEHRVVESGVSQGQLVSTRGVSVLATGPGMDRGGIYWNGVHYRVMGTKLVTVAGSTITTLGDVGGSSLVRMAYSFDRLAIVSDGRLFYWDGSALTEVTDPDLGTVEDVAWIDGYFALTDGEFPIVTDLLDPTSIDPLRYGSAETDPDPVTGVENMNEEMVVVGRHTIQFFQNAGTQGFPFRNVRGSAIPFGCVGPNAKCQIGGTLAFVGSGRMEPLGVFVVSGGTAVRISTREIEELFEGVDEALIEVEARRFGEDDHLIVHTPDASAMMKIRTTVQAQTRLWTILHSGRFDGYRPRRAVWDGSRHVVGDCESSALGVLSDSITEHFGEIAEWQFDVGLLYNAGTGLVLEEIELTGQFPLDRESTVFLSVTRDGEVWSNEVARRMQGYRGERCLWRPQVRMPAMSGARFRGNGRVSIARCDINGEALTA